MAGVTFSIAIDAPPERVFEHLADVPAHPTWANPKAKMTMEQTAGSGPGPDAAYRSSGVFVGKPVTADISVVAYENPGTSRSARSSTRRARRTSGTSTTTPSRPRAAAPVSRNGSPRTGTR